MATIADELNAISVEHGYTGAAPKTIAEAIDALADTLAGEDVDSGRSIASAIHALAPYIGTGGGSQRVELFEETLTVEQAEDSYLAALAYTGDITDDPLHVVFDGVEYELPKSLMGNAVIYGTFTDGVPDFSTYPLALEKDPDGWYVHTETAGTHTIVAYTEKSSGGFEPKGTLAIRVYNSYLGVPEGDNFLFRVDSRGPLQSMQDINSYGNVYQGVSTLDSQSFLDGNFGIVGGGLYVALAVTIDAAGDADEVHVIFDGSEIEDVMRFVAGNNVIISFQVPNQDIDNDIIISYGDNGVD